MNARAFAELFFTSNSDSWGNEERKFRLDGNHTRAAYRGAQFLRAPTSALRSPIAAAKQFRRERAT